MDGELPSGGGSVAEAEARVRARALGLLFVAGATIGVASLLLPHSGSANELALYSNIVLAYGGGALLLLVGHRFPTWVLQLLLALGSLLVTRAILYSGEHVSFYSVWFIWIGLYAFYFLSRRAAAIQVAFASGLYAITLVVEPGSSPIARWLTTVATLLVAGVFIDTLLRRARDEARIAGESAESMRRAADVAHELASLSDSTAARPELCAAAARVTGALGVALWEPSPDGTSLQMSGSSGRAPSQTTLTFVGLQSGPLRSFTGGETMFGGESEQAMTITEFAGSDWDPGVAIWQPVLREKVTVAVLAFYFQWLEPSARRRVVTVADLLATETSVTLDRIGLLARVEAMAHTDDLTGLANRRAWQDELPRELLRSRRNGGPVCVAMLDLDRFKAFNDDNGHQAGDRLLKQAAGAWTGQLRATDFMARYGGEEFALVLPRCGLPRALEVVERLRSATPGGVTCSAGVALWDGLESADQLLGRADRALYAAKQQGRDRIAVTGEPDSA